MDYKKEVKDALKIARSYAKSGISSYANYYYNRALQFNNITGNYIPKGTEKRLENLLKER